MAATSEGLGMAEEQIEEREVEVDPSTMLQTLGVLVHRAGGRVEFTKADVAAFHAGGPYELIASTENGNAVLTLRMVEQEEEG